MIYFVENWQKFVICIVLVAGYAVGSLLYLQDQQVDRTERSLQQLDESKGVAAQRDQMREHLTINYLYLTGWGIVALMCFFVFLGDIRNMAKKLALFVLVGLLPLSGTGCVKPFEPVKLETIKSNEEAFMLPLTGDGKKQTTSSNEEYLKANLVYTKQVQLPQQWVQLGRSSNNGEWRDAALLIKVDKSPVTREWTADPNTGTSNKNEAVWVMTSDQVEFSTGWTITARIANRDDAVKFLHNYPNGSLEKVMDSEVRSKLQAVFGLEVTDLPMDELRKNATPHINKTTKAVSDFFKERGLMITNLGITGGFVYKDKSIIDTMVKVFNAEQEKSVAIAGTNAQVERNKTVILEAQGKADAILKTKKAEADGIKLIAEAKAYELERAAKDRDFYLTLKQIDLEMNRLKSWDGKLPQSYFTGGGTGPMPTLLVPSPMLNKGSK